MTCHLASLGTVRTIFFNFYFLVLFYLILLLFLPRPGLAQDTSAPRTVGPTRIAPSRAQSPPRSLLLCPPHLGATTRLRPLPPLHHLYRPVLSEGLMSLAPPLRRPLPSSEPPRPRSLSPPLLPSPLFGPLPNKSYSPARRVPVPGSVSPFPVPSPTLSQSEGPCGPPLPLPTRTPAPGTM